MFVVYTFPAYAIKTWTHIQRLQPMHMLKGTVSIVVQLAAFLAATLRQKSTQMFYRPLLRASWMRIFEIKTLSPMFLANMPEKEKKKRTRARAEQEGLRCRHSVDCN